MRVMTLRKKMNSGSSRRLASSWISETTGGVITDLETALAEVHECLSPERICPGTPWMTRAGY